jgi:hypothetical protein
MKKLYVIVALLATSFAGFSQGRTIDLQISEIISPKSIHSGVTVQVKAVMKNNGPADFNMTDTILYRSVLQTTPTQWLATRPGRILKTGDTMHLNMNITGYSFTGTANTTFCVQVIGVNRSMDSVKVELTTGVNNLLCETIWFTDGTSGVLSMNAQIADATIYPNPVIGQAVIRFTNPEAAAVTVEIMDLTGKTVKTIEAGTRNVGEQTIELDALNLDSGVYMYTLTSGKYIVTKKFTVQ